VILYQNPLSSPEDLNSFVLEGSASLSFDSGVLRMENKLDPALGQKANYVLWCPEVFPDDIRVSWDFRPLREPGLAMLFFAASGRNGESIFDLAPRNGEYPQYHHGDLNAFHVSYFRRKEPDERAFHTCNLRKSWGFHLVAQGADPLPDASEDSPWYEISVVKSGALVTFAINDLELFRFEDDGVSYGPLLSGGRIGFRQLAPLVAEYRNLTVSTVSP